MVRSFVPFAHCYGPCTIPTLNENETKRSKFAQYTGNTRIYTPRIILKTTTTRTTIATTMVLVSSAIPIYTLDVKQLRREAK